MAAFAGGVLSLLAPCSALLLPAFFATAFTSSAALFFSGLSTVFVPLGLGAPLVSALLIDHRETTILAAVVLLIGFGLLELVGGGFSLLPASVAARFQGGRNLDAVYGTGLVYGISGFCAEPLLGAVLTMAGSAGSPTLGGALLFAYALGIAAPLFLMPGCGDRHQLGRRAWLRGRPLRLGPVEIHPTRLVSGVLFIVLGGTFIWFQGSSGLSGLYAGLGLDELGYRAQAWVDANAAQLPDGALVVAALFGATALLARRRRRLDGRPIGVGLAPT